MKIGTDPAMSSSYSSPPMTSFTPVMLTNETSLLKPIVPPPSSEPVVPTLTSEDVVVQSDMMQKSPSLVVNNPLLHVPGPNQLLEISSLVVNKSPKIPDNLAQAPEKFVPSLGSWVKPLHFKPPATPPEPSTPRDYDPAIVGNQLAALWPTLNDEIFNKQPKDKHPSRTIQPPIEKLPPPELKADGSLCFPWAARLSPQSRNLYRAATPTYHGGVLEPQKHTKEIEGLLSELEITPALQPTFQQENPTASPNFDLTLSTLVDSRSTPITAPIMDSSPSTVINTEVCETLVVDPLTTSRTSFAFESPSQFKELEDVDEVVTVF
ncbi:unnamed protein product [Eruca vesicaria subsp. sativa]|uniref:Uncharacterized protein n=1 Tax=Eruca vesicaria subsp. sativa TaxID=29727 RepID=A0ABC8KKQ9_ERUVS|nr:unnamed protein product [Eruca vesicaria subsp. sativa]